MDQRATRTFRRGTTMAWAVIMTIVIVGTAILMSIGLDHQGFLRTIAPLFAALPLLAFVVFACVWPKVVVAEDALTVQNAFVRIRIPYQDIKELIAARIGLILQLHSGEKIPVTAYVSGNTGKIFGHPKVLAEVMGAIEDKMSAVPATRDPDQAVVRTRLTANIVASIASVVLAIAVVWAAVAA